MKDVLNSMRNFEEIWKRMKICLQRAQLTERSLCGHFRDAQSHNRFIHVV